MQQIFESQNKKLMVCRTATASRNIALSMTFATAILGMGVTMPALAKDIQPISADYSFMVDSKKGAATRNLSKSGNTWQYNVKATVAGIANATQKSTFQLQGNQVVPSNASSSYKLFGVGRTHKLSFNPSSKNVVSTYRGKSSTFSAPYGAFDDLSLEVQIRQDLLNNRFTGNYYMAKKDKVEKIAFKKVGNYQMSVPAGTYGTVRVDRVHDDKSRTTSFWLAPSLDYLPVKVMQVDDGRQMVLELTKIH